MHDYDDYDFKYTDEVDPNSSLVDVAYYNANTKDLALDLNDQVYVYENVDEADFRKFYTEPSAGRYYNTEFKNKYGPAEILGHCDDLYFKDVPRESTASAGTPKDLTEPTKEYSLNINDAKAPFGTVETVGATKEYSLKTPDVVAKTNGGDFLIEVKYTLNHSGTEHVFSTNSDSLDDAMDDLNRSLTALGLTGKALKAVVYFE